MQHLFSTLEGFLCFQRRAAECLDLVRFLVYRRIKPHAPPLVRAPVNSFEFQPCGRTPQAGYLMVSLRHRTRTGPTPSTHRLGRGLPGYLILFAPHAFAPQRQSRPRRPSSPQAFLQISTHFTATPGIPPSPVRLKQYSFQGSPTVKLQDSTPDLHHRLRAL